MSLEKKINLLICTEEAPVLCPYFGLTKEEAKKEVNLLCSGAGIGSYELEAIWEKDKVIDVICNTKLEPVTDAICSSIGFDCALDNQCVNHGAVRPGIIETSLEYMLAEELVSLAPVNIYNFPHLFFACPKVNL